MCAAGTSHSQLAPLLGPQARFNKGHSRVLHFGGVFAVAIHRHLTSLSCLHRCARVAFIGAPLLLLWVEGRRQRTTATMSRRRCAALGCAHAGRVGARLRSQRCLYSSRHGARLIGSASVISSRAPSRSSRCSASSKPCLRTGVPPIAVPNSGVHTVGEAWPGSGAGGGDHSLNPLYPPAPCSEIVAPPCSREGTLLRRLSVEKGTPKLKLKSSD